MLRGAGKDFCIGRAQMGATPSKDPDALERRTFSDVVFNCYGAMRNAKIPIVAVVQGRALGFGCAIAAACDITLASDQAVFQVPEMAHNILPTMVMSSFVDRVPRKAMSYLVYSQAAISAERALSFGIVSDVVAGRQARRRRGDAVRRDPQGAAAGDPRRQGIRQDRARHGGVWRRRIRPQPARHRQFIGGDATEARLGAAMIVVAIDIGGTFTDLVGFDEAAGQFIEAKTLTTPHELSQGILDCIRKSGIAAGTIDELIHGSTTAINTLIERKGAKTGLIVTRGTRDVYIIGRGNRPEAYNLFFHRHRPLVPRHLTREVEERVLSSGEVFRPLNKASVTEACRALAAEGVEAVAVCLLARLRQSRP